MTTESPDETLTGFDTSDDLDAFSKELFNRSAPDKEEVTKVEPEIEESEVEDEVEETTDIVDDADETEESEEEVEKPKSKKTAADRIKELTAKNYELERTLTAKHTADLEALKAEITKLSEAQKPKEYEPARLPDGAPDPTALDKDGNLIYELGQFDPKYNIDLVKFTLNKEREASEVIRKQEEYNTAVAKARDEATTAWVAKVEAIKTEVPDIVEKIGALNNIVGPVEINYAQYLVDVVKSLDNGPKVIAYLADNPATAREIVSSGAASATVALGRLDARMTTVIKPKENKTPTKANTPPAQVPRGTNGRFAIKGDEDDLEAFSREYFKKR